MRNPRRATRAYHWRSGALGSMIMLLFSSVSPSTSWAQPDELIDAGRNEFQRSCATCHGNDAKGGGPTASSLLVAPPNLTIWAESHGGVFLFWRMYDIIEGSEDRVIRGHGSRQMPIWGDQFQLERGAGEGQQTGVRGRILSLVHYLQSIQEE